MKYGQAYIRQGPPVMIYEGGEVWVEASMTLYVHGPFDQEFGDYIFGGGIFGPPGPPPLLAQPDLPQKDETS